MKENERLCDSISLFLLPCSNFQYDYTDTGIAQQAYRQWTSEYIEYSRKGMPRPSTSIPTPSEKMSIPRNFLEENLKNFHASGNGRFNRRLTKVSILPLPRIYIDAACRASRYYLVRCVHVRSFYSQGRSRKISGDKRD